MGCVFRKEKAQSVVYKHIVFFCEEEKEGDGKEKRDCPMKEWNNYTLREQVFGYNKKPVIKDYLITENKE